MAEVREALEGCDLILMIVDAVRPHVAEDDYVLQLIKRGKTPAVLLLNKIDLLRAGKLKLLPIIEQYSRMHEFCEIIPISARKRQGFDVLIEKLFAYLPEGPHYFTDDQITDQPARFMAAELIREQVLFQTSEEVPHSTTVIVEQFDEAQN